MREKLIEELEAKLAEREEAVCNLRKKWDAAETHICTMCGHFNHKTDGNIVYGNKDCGEIVGYPCCGKFTPWIPVSERLPEKDGWYQVWTKNPLGGFKSFNKASFHNGEWHGGGGKWTNVTHWMPLPEPPKENT